MNTLRLALVLAPLVLASLPRAQAFRGGDVIVPDYATDDLFRVEPNGTVSPLVPPGTLLGPSGIAADLDGSLVVCDFDRRQLVRIEPSGAVSPIAMNLAGPLRVAVDVDGSYLVTMTMNGGIERVFRSGAVASFVPQGAGGMSRAWGVALDGAGGCVFTDDNGAGLYHVGQRGTVTAIHVGAPFRLPQGVALFPNGDYAVFDGITDSVFRVDRTTGAVSTFVSTAALGGNPDGIAPSGDGGLFVSQSGIAGNRVVHVDASGTVTQLAAGAPFANLEDCAMVPLLTAPAAPTTGPGSAAPFAIDAPQHPNALYTLVLSGALFPGLTLPGEARAMALQPDGLFLATFATNLPPLMTNWTATTDPLGRATPTIDLFVLPAGFLAGRTFWTQALVFAPGAPNSVGTITNIAPLTFR